jgi:hypothetical protein
VRKAGKSRTAAVIVVIVVALVVLVPIVAGFLNDPAPPPAGGVTSVEPTVPPEIQHALKEIARRQAAQRYCNAHPEAAATQRCLDGV